MITFGSRPYVFISLADGPIIYYSLDREQGLLYDRKKVSLGTKPTTLTICQQSASSSASVNLREIVCMCSFNSEYYGASLILVTNTGVILGRIDGIQKLHTRTLRLGESVRRIAFIDKEKVYAVLTQSRHECQADGILPVSKQAHQKIDCPTKIKAIEDLTAERNESDNSSSIVILNQHTHEGTFFLIWFLLFSSFS